MKIKFFNINNKKLIAAIFLILVIVTILTKYYGSTDIGDYADVAKYFANELSSKIRGSHSYLLGFIHAPFVKLFNNFFIFKISSLFFIALIIYSLYRISNRDKKTLWLALLSPVIWYMAPWINPIQLASLFFLWAYYFIDKYDKENKLGYLACSGLFIGLAWAFWDTIFFFGIFLALSFLYNKKLSHSLFLIIFIIIGLGPRLILDTYFLNFPFYTILKSTFGAFANIFGGVYNKAMFQQASSYFSSGIIPALISLLLSIPLYFWLLYKPEFFKKHKKAIIFISLSLLLILTNPQIRYILTITPIILLLISKNLNKVQFNRQIIIFIFIIALFIFPYIIQINYSIDNLNYGDFTYILEKGFKIDINRISNDKLIAEDLLKITKEYPNSIFVVGNLPDEYQRLSRIYWGDNVNEFVSIQDYELFLDNKTVLFEKKFMPVPKIADRRQIWIAGGMDKSHNDKTDYSAINLALGLGEPVNLTGFNLTKKYDYLYLSQKE